VTRKHAADIPMLVAGKWDIFEKIMKMNTANMQKKGVKTFVTSCPAVT
jgi:Fe-S oxidoreductase